MAVDAFLKIADLKGDSIDKSHPDEIHVLSWGWGMSQMGTTHYATGGGAGKAEVSDLQISHWVDSATPGLMSACCKGTHFDEAVLTMRKAGENPLDYLIITMTDCIITSVQPSGSSGGDQAIETFMINFAKYKVSYQPQDNKGAKKGGAIEVEYNIAENA